jgi:hypothetical protein
VAEVECPAVRKAEDRSALALRIGVDRIGLNIGRVLVDEIQGRPNSRVTSRHLDDLSGAPEAERRNARISRLSLTARHCGTTN